MQRIYENLDEISTLAEYRGAFRHVATDVAKGLLTLKKAGVIIVALKELRGSLSMDVALHGATGAQMNPTGEAAAWSVPQEVVEEPKAAKPKAAVTKTAGQEAADAGVESSRRVQKLENLHAKEKRRVAAYEAQVEELKTPANVGGHLVAIED